MEVDVPEHLRHWPGRYDREVVDNELKRLANLIREARRKKKWY